MKTRVRTLTACESRYRHKRRDERLARRRRAREAKERAKRQK